jgi:hypothetical protein
MLLSSQRLLLNKQSSLGFFAIAAWEHKLRE